jgi:hypothetical protein
MSPLDMVQPMHVVLMIYANGIAMGAHDAAYVQASFFTYSANIHHT